MTELRITDIRFCAASAEQQREGLEGWVRCVVNDWLRLDSLQIRRRADGTLAMFFPEHVDRQDRAHALVWPIRAEDREEMAARVLCELSRKAVLS